MRNARVRPLSCSLFLAMGAASAMCPQNHPVDGSAMQVYEAHATSVTGQVTRIRDEQPWALTAGERVPIQQLITTGSDGYAHFEVAGGSSFDLYSNSRVIFRQNATNAGDLLDILAGRVRIHLRPTIGQQQQRVFTPVATIATHGPATLAIAIDEEDTVRIDVTEGEVRVQHLLLPRNEPTVVRAIDAILVQKDQPISRRVDRGSLYRYTTKVWTAMKPGHSARTADPVDGKKLLAEAMRSDSFCMAK